MGRGLGIELTVLAVAIIALFAVGKLVGVLASIQMRLVLALFILLAVVSLLLWRRFRRLRKR
jgi:membrane protein implicated in regulation of membrane protease activity